MTTVGLPQSPSVLQQLYCEDTIEVQDSCRGTVLQLSAPSGCTPAPANKTEPVQVDWKLPPADGPQGGSDGDVEGKDAPAPPPKSVEWKPRNPRLPLAPNEPRSPRPPLQPWQPSIPPRAPFPPFRLPVASPPPLGGGGIQHLLPETAAALGSSGLTPADIQVILNEHNTVRRNHRVQALTWDPALAAYAQVSGPSVYTVCEVNTRRCVPCLITKTRWLLKSCMGREYVVMEGLLCGHPHRQVHIAMYRLDPGRKGAVR